MARLPEDQDDELSGTYLRARLAEEKGNWPTIAEESGVPYGTLEKVGQGDTENPSLPTARKIRDWFRARDAMRQSLRSAAA
jgi:hypothetical protein